MIFFFSIYLTFNILLLLAFVGIELARRIVTFDARTILKIQYQLFTSVFVVLFISLLWPSRNLFEPMARVWSSPPARGVVIPSPGVLIVSGLRPTSGLNFASFSNFIEGSFAAILIVAALLLLRDLFRLFRLTNSSQLKRKIGRVQIRSHAQVVIPFSYWSSTGAHVLVPERLFLHPRNAQIAIAHEIQHHRQGDTRWLFFMFVLRALCFLNPAVHFWGRRLGQDQEFACDEALVANHKVHSKEYASCLVEVAQNAMEQKRSASVQGRRAGVPVGATGFLLWTDRNLLKRRIETMLKPKMFSQKTGITVLTTSVIIGLMGATAFAAKNLIQDRRVTLSEAQGMTKNLSPNTDFPVVVDDLVLKWLNYFIGTPEGREQSRKALQQMQSYQSMITTALNNYGVPEALLAIPFIESGFQNKPQSANLSHGAGLWMFIQRTARIYGMRVDQTIDQRLNPDMETDAAMRYLLSNKYRFNNWQLSVMAYNMGENAVQAAIDEAGTRDAWTLVRKGYENDHNYLPKLMAAILIIHNPESVN